jgi:hypothetical protein
MSNLERMSFTVPLIPPSVNHYKTRFRNGRTVVSQEALAFKAELALAAKHQYVVGKEFSVDMLIVLGKGEKGDVDNFPKLVLDGLAACGAFQSRKGKGLSDATVSRMGVKVNRNSRPQKGYTCIAVEAIR